MKTKSKLNSISNYDTKKTAKSQKTVKKQICTRNSKAKPKKKKKTKQVGKKKVEKKISKKDLSATFHIFSKCHFLKSNCEKKSKNNL